MRAVIYQCKMSSPVELYCCYIKAAMAATNISKHVETQVFFIVFFYVKEYASALPSHLSPSSVHPTIFFVLFAKG
jgi:hypothetical protein